MKITKSKLRRLIQEELEQVMTENPPKVTVSKQTFRNKKLSILNAWNGYAMKGRDSASMKNLIKILKSFNIPKDLAMQILKASSGKEVLALIKEDINEQEGFMPDTDNPLYERMVACLKAAGNTKCLRALETGNVTAFLKCLAESPNCANLLTRLN